MDITGDASGVDRVDCFGDAVKGVISFCMDMSAFGFMTSIIFMVLAGVCYAIDFMVGR